MNRFLVFILTFFFVTPAFAAVNITLGLQNSATSVIQGNSTNVVLTISVNAGSDPFPLSALCNAGFILIGFPSSEFTVTYADRSSYCGSSTTITASSSTDITIATLSQIDAETPIGDYTIVLSNAYISGVDSLTISSSDKIWTLSVASAGGSTTLSQLAASLNSGEWTTWTITNLTSCLSDTGVSGYVFGYATTGVWNPIGGKIQYLGGDHGNGVGPSYIEINEATDTCTNFGHPSWAGSGTFHGNDGITGNPVTGDFYRRIPFSDEIYRLPYGANPLTGWLSPTDSGGVSYIGHSYFPYDAGIEFFPGWGNNGGILYAAAENGSIGSAVVWDAETNTWSRPAQAQNTSPWGTDHTIAEYDPVQHTVVYGGGGDSPSNQLWSIDSSGNVTALSTPPIPQIGVESTILVADPTSGKLLVFDNNEDMYSYDFDTDSWTQENSGIVPPIWTDAVDGNGNPVPVHGALAIPISDYGVIVFLTCNNSSTVSCSAFVYKYRENFADLCARSGVIMCRDFTSSVSFGTYGSSNEGVYVNGYGSACPTLPADLPDQCPVAGDGTLKFTIASESGSGSAGAYFVDFADLYRSGTEIGPGDDVYIRWEQKFDAAFLSTTFDLTSGQGGWKQMQLGDKDQTSCADNEVVIQNTAQKGVVQGYHACPSPGPSEPFQAAPAGSPGDITIQPGGDFDATCLYPGPYGAPDCYPYYPDEWMRFKVKVHYSTNSNDNVTVWVARQDDVTWTKVIDYDLNLVETAGADGFGTVTLSVYHTNKDPAQVTNGGADMYVYFKNLVVSTSDIEN